MADTTSHPHTPATRSDIDISNDIHDLMIHYPPLAHDRHHLDVTVNNGHVTVAGNIKAPPTYSHLLKTLPTIEGVQSVDHNNLYLDDQIQREVGSVVSPGIFVNMEYGAVKLTGTLPAGMKIESLVEKVGAVPGVTHVVTALRQG